MQDILINKHTNFNATLISLGWRCPDIEKTHINELGDCGHDWFHFVQQTLCCGFLVVEWEKVILESSLHHIHGGIECVVRRQLLLNIYIHQSTCHTKSVRKAVNLLLLTLLDFDQFNVSLWCIIMLILRVFWDILCMHNNEILTWHWLIRNSLVWIVTSHKCLGV